MKIWLGYSPHSPEWTTFKQRMPDAALEYDLAEQGSAKWHGLRIGIPTASKAKDIITPAKGDLSKGRLKYGYQLVAERLLNMPLGPDLGSIRHIEEGRIREGEAREAYGAIVGETPLLIGFVKTDDERYGCSPDSLLWLEQKRVGLEIKSPQPSEHVASWIHYLTVSEDSPRLQYKPQTQMQILTANLDRVDFFSHNAGFPDLLVEFDPDDDYIKKMEGHLHTFCDELDHWEGLLRQQGVFATRETVPSNADLKADAIIADPDKMRELRDAVDMREEDVLDLAIGAFPPAQQERVRHAIETGRRIIE